MHECTTVIASPLRDIKKNIRTTAMPTVLLKTSSTKEQHIEASSRTRCRAAGSSTPSRISNCFGTSLTASRHQAEVAYKFLPDTSGRTPWHPLGHPGAAGISLDRHVGRSCERPTRSSGSRKAEALPCRGPLRKLCTGCQTTAIHVYIYIYIHINLTVSYGNLRSLGLACGIGFGQLWP